MAESLLANQDFIFIVTWNIDRLPIYGKEVIPYVLGDEHFQAPSYINKVGPIIKSMGSSSWHETHGKGGSMLMNFSEFCKRKLILFETLIRKFKHKINNYNMDRIFTIPLGYYNFSPQQYRNYHERKWDIFFAGALTTGRRFPHSLLTFMRPLAVARKQMINAFSSTQYKYSKLICYPNLTTNPVKLERFESDEYSVQMSQAKVALCPRGSHPETFRFFEAAQCGAIILSDPLPPHWYYKDCPAIIVTNWKQLPDLIDKLFESPLEMQHLSELTHNWFVNIVHPEIIGTKVAEFIERHAD
ncbi:MAG: glycosyltransferase family 1 protein [Fimbriimonadaceae bacterium]|nr:glycosyltransferase family 1 protein [Fimbriimonadaceae bacterium]